MSSAMNQHSDREVRSVSVDYPAVLGASTLDRGLPWLAALGLGVASGLALGWPAGGLAAGAVAFGEWTSRGRRDRTLAKVVGEMGRWVELASAPRVQAAPETNEPVGQKTAEQEPVEQKPAEQSAVAEPAPKPAEARRERANGGRPASISTLLAELAPELSSSMRGVERTATRLSDTDLTIEQRDCLETIQVSNGMLISLVGDVLDLAKIDAGRMKLRRRDFQLGSVADTIAEELYPLAWKKGLELSIDVAPELSDWVWGDRRRIEQLLRHLVRGAIQSTDRGEVQLKLVQSSPDEPGRGPVRFEIHDTAPVHTQAELARLLESSPGNLENLAELDLSLGMLLAGGLVEVMGGSLGAHAKGSGGNLFWFEIPLEATEGPQTGIEGSFNALIGVKLLVVDARAAARETLVGATRRFGLIVEEAESSGQACEMLTEAVAEKAAFDVVLIDDDLHGGKGRALAERIAALPDAPKPALILLTASGRAQNPAHLAELGIDAWIPKPVRVQRLQEALLHVSSGAPVTTAVAAEVTTEESAPQAPPIAPVGRLLLVEGERCGTRLLEHRCRQAGWRVEVLSGARGLSDAFSDGVYDAVVLDAACSVKALAPELLDLREVLRASGSKSRVLALMSQPDAGLEEAWIRAGVDLCWHQQSSQPAFGELLTKTLREGVAPSHPIPLKPQSIMDNPSEQVLDPEVIECLKELGGEDDPGLFAELVDMFLHDTPERLTALQTALASDDIKEIERVAHSMKSSCGNLGAMGLADLCFQIEMAGRNGTVDDLKSLVERSDDEYQRVRSALESELA